MLRHDTTTPDFAMLGPADVAAALRFSRRTVERMAVRGDLPAPRRIAGRPRWLAREFAAWLDAQPRARGGQP